MSKLKSLTKNFSMTLTANIVSLGFNAALVLILPKVLSQVAYGQWQFYMLLAQFIGYLTLGITDGVYIRYGGEEYNSLPHSLFRSQFWFLVILHAVSDFFIYALALTYTGGDRLFVFIMMGISGVLYVPITLITFTLQGTNRIKDYSIITITERLIVIVIILFLAVFGVQDFRFYVLADVVGKLLSLIQATVIAPEIVIGKLPKISDANSETKTNISVGIKILIANLASLFINSLVRLVVEFKWGIVVFGKISLALSIANIITTMILALSLVFFPALKRESGEDYPRIYSNMRNIINIPIALMLILYYPLFAVLSVWLPNYVDSLKILGILFPLTLFEGNVKLLTNNFSKAMRKESFLMWSNIFTIIISLLVSTFSAFVIGDLTITVSSIVFIHFIRAAISDAFLNQQLNVNTKINLLYEVILALSFSLGAWFLPWYWSMLFYLLVYIFYLFVKREDLAILKNIFLELRK